MMKKQEKEENEEGNEDSKESINKNGEDKTFKDKIVNILTC